jgi:hypothetical protein
MFTFGPSAIRRLLSRLLAAQSDGLNAENRNTRLSLTLTTNDAENSQAPADAGSSDPVEEAESGVSRRGTFQDTQDDVGNLAEEAEHFRHTSQISSIDIRQIARSAEAALPFAVLVLIVFLYHHFKSVALFSIGSLALHRCNGAICRQAARKSKAKRRPLAICAAVMLIAALVIVRCAFGSGQLLRVLLFHGIPMRTDFWSTAFAVCTADLILRLCLGACKAIIIATMPVDSQARARRRGGLLTAADYCCDVPRTALPVPMWIRYFMDAGMLPFFVIIVSGVYLLLKAAAVLEKTSLASAALRQWRGIGYGIPPTAEELAADPICAICHDNLRSPVRLRCGHQFDDGCIAEWLARESTCPMCRCAIRQEALKSRSDGTTSLFPVLC